MPILSVPEMEERITLPPREARRAGKADVLVVGGGPAGIGAALGAAKAGARVILVERYGFLGGNATAALVMPLMSFHNQHRTKVQVDSFRLWPTDHGEGEPVISGVLEEFLSELLKAGGAIAPSPLTGYVVPFDPELFKWTALRMLLDRGVHLLLHAWASDVIRDNGRLRGVAFYSKSGFLVVEADAVVDCTGDGDIAAFAGAEYELGRETDGLTQPMTLMFRMADFDAGLFEEYVKKNPGQWRGVHGLWDLLAEAQKRGELGLAREDVLFFGTPHEREVAVNSTRVTGVSGISVWDLSRAECASREQMQQIVRFLKKYVPGFSESYAVQSGVQVGVRETRRICGQYRLTVEDILEARHFPDVIARNSYPLDIHNPKGKGTLLKNLPPGKSYDIPLRCLIPKNTRNLLVAGRCISGTHEAHSSYRVMPVCMATGQAAGVCAAICVREGSDPSDMDADKVQKELLSQGVNLG